MNKLRNRRIFKLFALIVVVFSILTVNVFVVSVLGYHVNSGTNIKEVVDGIHTVEAPIYAKRGRILDVNGNVLVEDTEAFTLHAYVAPDRFGIGNTPAYVTDKDQAADEISKILKAPRDFVLSQLNADAKQVEFGVYGKYITPDQKKQLEETEITGLGFIPVLKRDYYSSQFATTLLGMTTFNEEKKVQQGIMGIEQYYDDVLSGTNGLEVYRQDRDQYRFDTIDSLSYDSKDGSHVKLTIDKIIQSSLDSSLNRLLTHEEVNASEAWGAVLDIKTGKILAISDAPSFDIDDENTIYMNRATEYEYEPGSTMKTLTYAAAINEGVIKPDDRFDGDTFYLYTDPDTGKGQRVSSPGPNTATIHNPSQEIYPMITYEEGFQRSSNVMIAELLTDKLNTEIFREYLHKLGFFKPVNIGRIPEGVGTELWQYHHEKVTNGFGQGSTVTMLQLLQAHTAIFGDGTIVKPYIIDSIINPDTNEVEYQAETQVGERIFKEETAQLVRDAMYRNVNEKQYGNHRFKMDEINIMAKSGTSQIVIDGAYSNDTFLFSAMLGFPYENPQYAFYFAYIADEWHRSWVSADILKNVIKTTIVTYPVDTNLDEVTPQDVQGSKLDNHINRPIGEVTSELNESGYQVIVLGDGKTVIDQYPKKGVKLLSNERVLLLTEKSNMSVPNMSGWSLKEVNAWANFARLEIITEGSGFVKEQSIAPKTKINQDMKIKVRLE